MSPERFNQLLQQILPLIQTNDTKFRECIPAEKRLVITLCFMSRGIAQEALAHNFRIGNSTVSNILKETCSAIYTIMSPIYMSIPTTKEQWKTISNESLELWNMPHVLGAIDGKHINIECPAKTGSLYYNYKDFFLLVLLAVYDAKYKFLYIDVGQYGSTNDSVVLNNSSLGESLATDSLNFPD